MTAGTDSTRATDCAETAGGPAVILVEPQMGENIGAAARAMLNCGLTEMRLVRPRDGWPNPRAEAAASGATLVLDRAQVFATTADAIADLHKVYATTARTRDMIQRVLTPARAARELRTQWSAGWRVGLMFGPERTGLHNDDLTLADTLISVPLNPAFSSLNLAQAVLLLGYEWYQSEAASEPETLHLGATRPATKAEVQNLFDHLEAELDACGFFSTPEKRPSMVRNIRNAIQRMAMTEQEVRTWHGIITGLTAGSRNANP
ncbi:MAG: RNA methyltransferase [Azospirillaceae bacterium]|nr:RNA methyltransferase [Azospirillaceae bacterium]